MSIALNIKALRSAYKLSQKELATIAGVTDKAVSSWEVGAKEPRMGTIQKMADYFGIQKSMIIEDDGINFYLSQAKSDHVALYKASKISGASQSFPTPAKAETEELSEDEKQLIKDYRSLNDDGKTKVIENTESMTYNPKYKKCDNSQFFEENA